MLITGIILIFVASLIGGWYFMCDTLTFPPKLARSPVPLLVAAFIALVGIALLFVVKWYLGLLGIAGAVICSHLFAKFWHRVYKVFRL